MRHRREKWRVGTAADEFESLNFTRLSDAKKYAKDLSKEVGADDEVNIELIDNACYYFDYINGKCVRDGWTIRK